MSGESDHSITNSLSQVETDLSRWKLLMIYVNLAFGISYFILTLWQITLLLPFAILPPFYILIFWANQKMKYEEFQNALEKDKTPNFNLSLDLIALAGNLVSLVFLAVLVLTTSQDSFIFLLTISPLFIATMINFETLGKSVAYIRVTRVLI